MIIVLIQNSAVKVQYPRLRFHYTGDMTAKRIFVDLLEKAFPKIDFSWLGPELEEALVKELDFLNEVSNMRKCEQLFKHRTDLYIPQVIDRLTSDKGKLFRTHNNYLFIDTV
jgi:predicted unusual protein kinase regulating ubiquinone biosynthesis (AarF/ABC1/UbiB family)